MYASLIDRSVLMFIKYNIQEDKLMAVKCNLQQMIMNLLIHDWQIFPRVAVYLGISTKRRELR
jgi:hypothetical protein